MYYSSTSIVGFLLLFLFLLLSCLSLTQVLDPIFGNWSHIRALLICRLNFDIFIIPNQHSLSYAIDSVEESIMICKWNYTEIHREHVTKEQNSRFSHFLHFIKVNKFPFFFATFKDTQSELSFTFTSLWLFAL